MYLRVGPIWPADDTTLLQLYWILLHFGLQGFNPASSSERCSSVIDSIEHVSKHHLTWLCDQTDHSVILEQSRFPMIVFTIMSRFSFVGCAGILLTSSRCRLPRAELFLVLTEWTRLLCRLQYV